MGKSRGKVAWSVAFVLVVLFFVFGNGIIFNLHRSGIKLRALRGERLAKSHGMVLLADFDESVPHDAVSTAMLTYTGVNRTKGRFGNARKINLDRQPTIGLPVTAYHTQSKEATFAAWFRPQDIVRDQFLFSLSNNGSGFRLLLSQNELKYCGFDGTNVISASCAFNGKPGEFTHVGLAIREDGASIWQNGRKTADVALPAPMQIATRLNAYGMESHCPFEGDIDDLAIWSRALSAKEFRSIAKASRGLKYKYEPLFSTAIDLSDKTAKFTCGLFRCTGRLIPVLVNPAQTTRKLPTLTVWTSRKDSRHFIFAHEESIESGFRTSKAADFRTVDISFGGRTMRMQVALDDVYGRSDVKRMAFIVKDPSRTMFGGCGMIRLYPPELHQALHPDAQFPLPVSGSFVRLYHEDSFKGIYVVERMDSAGGAWKAYGSHDPYGHRPIHFDSPLSACDIVPDGISPREAFSTVSALVRSDVLFPWSRQEIRARKKMFLRRRADNKFRPERAYDELLQRITAGNPSPMFVTNDLAMNIPGVTWESSDPSVVSPDGHVVRPQRGAPVAVTLTPTDSNGERGVPRRVRVAPLAPDLQALFLYVGYPVEKHRRSDFVCYRVPAGGGDPEWITGIGGSNGGIKHRGNTSYVKGSKRSFSLEFDEKVSWPGSSRKAQHVLLFSGYADPTRLRNKVSFDSYRVAASDDVPCGAIDVSWSEVFINGEYFGIWETCRRAKDICDPKTYLFKIRARNPNFWNTDSTDMAECVSAYDPRSNPYSPLQSLFRFTANSTPEEFAGLLDKTFHVDSIVDYALMLNFTENYDGQITNQYIGRRKGEDQWFIIPWDYDKTFFGTTRIGLGNLLVTRIYRDIPDFRARLSKKWQTLRNGPMSDEAVLGRIDSDAALLAPYMEEEYRLLQPAGWDSDFEAAVSRLKEVVAGRLQLMDSTYLQDGE